MSDTYVDLSSCKKQFDSLREVPPRMADAVCRVWLDARGDAEFQYLQWKNNDLSNERDKYRDLLYRLVVKKDGTARQEAEALLADASPHPKDALLKGEK